MRKELLMLLLLGAASVGAGCRAGSPTSADITQYETPERIYASGRVRAHADALGIRHPEVRFEDPPGVTPTPAGWVVPGVWRVHFNAAWIAGAATQGQINEVAAHEVCHLAVGDDEDAAESCKRGLLGRS